MTLLVVAQIERRVDEREVREEPLCRYAAGETEQIVVRVARVVVHALLDLEYLYREDRSLAVAESGVGGFEQALHDESALRRRVHAVVQRAERNLRSGARVHSVEIVYQRLHSLIGRALGLGYSVAAGRVNRALRGLLAVLLGNQPDERRREHTVVGERWLASGRLRRGFDERLGVGFACHIVAQHIERFHKIAAVELLIGLLDAGSHAVLKVRYALTAVLVVLVRLNSYAGERRVAGDVLRRAQEAVSGREAVLEQLQNIYLAAGSRKRQEVEVVDVYIALSVRLRVNRVEDVHLVELLRALRAVFEHRTHSGVAVDISVLALDVRVARRLKRQVLVGLH